MIEIDAEALEKIDAALKDWESVEIPGKAELDAELVKVDEIVQQIREKVLESVVF